MALNGLGTINIELTSRCNKNCWMCGRRKVDRDFVDLALDYGDMEFSLLEKIAPQIPEGIVVQFHRDGDALVYPRFGDAVKLFPNNVRNIVTNGKLLVGKADEISRVQYDHKGTVYQKCISQRLRCFITPLR